MATVKAFSKNMRVWHRYLGFFLAGIMAMYAISGIILTFRDTDFLKKEYEVNETLTPQLSAEDLGRELRNPRLQIISDTDGIVNFENGSYNSETGEVSYTVKKLPVALDKMTRFHKARSGEPLFYLNIITGTGLLFFIISSFWMFLPSSKIFMKSMYFAGTGLLLAALLLMI